jgi:hypothetical protein
MISITASEYSGKNLSNTHQIITPNLSMSHLLSPHFSPFVQFIIFSIAS